MDRKTFRVNLALPCKMCQNTGFIFDSSIYGKIRARENTYSGIFYAVSGNVALLEKIGLPRTLLWENFQKQNKLRKWRLGTNTYKNAKITELIISSAILN